MPNLIFIHSLNDNYTGKKYFDDDAYNSVINYCLRDNKTPDNYIGGFGVNVNQAALEMELIAKSYGRNDRKRLRHFVLSFSAKEARKLNKKYCFEELNRIGWYAASFYGNEYQIIYAVHQDAEHPHIHFVQSMINYKTGKKYRGERGEYKFRNYLGKMLMEYYGFQLRVVVGDEE